MTSYIALLRGINVGGSKRVAMADVRALLVDLGHGAVATHLQSGNALFESSRDDEAALAAEIEAAISGRLGLQVSVLVRTREEVARVVAANPIREAVADPSRLHVVFLSAAPEPALVAAVAAVAVEPEVVRFGEREVYVWYRGGFADSKLTGAFWERRLRVRATARNWNTVTRLLSLAGGS